MSNLPVRDEKNKLPIDHFKERILSLLNVNSIIVIQGPAGCGKTTQIPQYILDDARKKNQCCNIAVSLPTQIAAINIARRVCKSQGAVCGYEVGVDKDICSDTLLTYMPTDVLLQKIISAGSLDQFTHIIIDDFHEKNQDLDFLLLLVKSFLFSNFSKTKIILMSAPNDADAKHFSYYFGSKHNDFCLPAPIISAHKETDYTRDILYIEDICSVLMKPIGDSIKFAKAVISQFVWRTFISLVTYLNKLDKRNSNTNKLVIGSVLVFLPGIKEIGHAKYLLEQRNKSKWEVVLLHSLTSVESQAQVLKPPSAGYRKVILCTSVAENSITIPKTCYVIDFCQTKVMRVDPLYNYSVLKSEWASHVNCDQRAGRVGRTGNGTIFRLVPSTFYNKNMPKWPVPEIFRAPLDRVVLRAKMLGINKCPGQVLGSIVYPPTYNVEDAIFTLKEIGGLMPTCEGHISLSDGDLTFLGAVMASLPIDVGLSKLIVLGHLFGCLEEAIIIAAGCTITNIALISTTQKLNDYKTMLDVSSSDFLALLNYYKSSRDKPMRKLSEWDLLITDIKQRLQHMNIKATTGPDKIVLNNEKALILNIIIAGAFYPNYFVIVNEMKHQQLNGSHSSKLRGCISSSANKILDIDGKSINACLLHTQPENFHTRLLVASYISQTDNGQRWTLCQTSLLPDIPGLAMLLSLLFCQTMKVQLTEDRTRVASILCGAGYNKYTRRAYYPLHDLTLTLDTELTQHEVNKINRMRWQMNRGIQFLSRQKHDEKEMISIQDCLTKELKELISIPRKLVDRVTVESANDWRENNIDIVLKPDIYGEESDIWPLLSFIKFGHRTNGQKYKFSQG